MRRTPEGVRRRDLTPFRPLSARRTIRTFRRARQLIARVVTVAALLAASLLATDGAAHADYAASNLPDWAIGPFTRQSQPNPAPVLSPTGTGWESQHVLNPGVVYRNNAFQMLYRADGGGPDQIGLATSTDGLNFTRNAGNPVITDNVLPYESGGVTDPRLYELNGTYYSFVAALQLVQQPSADHHGDHLNRPGPLDDRGADRAHQLRPIGDHRRQRHPGADEHAVRSPVRHVLRRQRPRQGPFYRVLDRHEDLDQQHCVQHELPCGLQPMGDLRRGYELPDRRGRPGQPQRSHVRGRHADGQRTLVLRH